MNQARWDKLEALFDEARTLPPEERVAFLERTCEDASLRAEAASMLAAHERNPRYLEHLGGEIRSFVLHALQDRRPADDTDDAHQLAGQRIRQYQIIEPVGRGGMGVVYKARDTRLERFVALKFLPLALSADDRARSRLITEARMASALDHPNIAPIYEVGEVGDGQLFIVMPFYEGETLAQRIEQGLLPMKKALDYALQLSDGLAAAHRKDIVHRDVKPANVMITGEGTLKILDFGLARAIDFSLSTVEARAGTAPYMAPEQIAGGSIDHRTDLWAFGVVLYEMLTGERPFTGEYQQALFYAIQHEAPPRLTEHRPDLPAALDDIVQHCLKRDPAERYTSAAALQSDLRRLEDSEAPAPKSLTDRKTIPTHSKETVSARTKTFLATRWRSVSLAMVFFALLLLATLQGDRTTLLPWLNTLPEERKVVVLPFRGGANTPEDAAFRDGLMETLTSKLTQLERFSEAPFWVVPTSEVLDREVNSAEEARRVFGANLAISGSVQREAGGQVRLTLNLIDTRNLHPLGAEVIDYPVDNSTALQDEAVVRAAGLLKIELDAEADRILAAGGTIVPGAYEFYLQGRGYLQRYEDPDNVETAIGLFEKALDEDDSYALAHAGLGEAYLRKYTATRDVEWAEQAIHHGERAGERAAELDDMLAPVHATLGLIYTETGRYGEALRAFQQALQIDPFNAEAYRGRARAYEAQGRFEEAEAAHKRAIALKPDYWVGYNALGAFYYRQGRLEDAIEPFRQVTQLTPDNTYGYNNLGTLYYYLEQWEEAYEMFKQSLNIEPSYYASSNLGNLYLYEGRYGEAARMYEQALELNDQDHRVWGNLAKLYYWTPEEESEAEAFYQEAIQKAEEQRKVDDDAPELLSALATYYVMIDDTEEARALIGRALEQGLNSSDVLFDAAYTYEQLGEREAALQWIEEALAQGLPLTEVEREPALRQLRSDARFQRLLTSDM